MAALHCKSAFWSGLLTNYGCNTADQEQDSGIDRGFTDSKARHVTEVSIVAIPPAGQSPLRASETKAGKVRWQRGQACHNLTKNLAWLSFIVPAGQR
jgi:hypothetical protein